MVLCNARYQVTTEVQWTPLLDGCDVIHNPNNINLNDIYSARLIEIQGHDGRARKVALVELVTSGFEPDNNFHKLFALPFIVSSMVFNFSTCKLLGDILI